MRMSAEQDGSTHSREEPGAFDLWMKRVLQERYGRVAREPVPDDLLRLLGTQSTEH